DTTADTSYFTVKFTPVVTVDATTEVQIDMAFTPRVGVKFPTAKLLLTTEGPRIEDSTAVITLKGQGEGGACDLPDVLDFGDVPVGEHFKLSWSFRSTAAVDGQILVSPISGSDAMSFTSSLSGMVTLPAMQTVTP